MFKYTSIAVTNNYSHMLLIIVTRGFLLVMNIAANHNITLEVMVGKH